MTKPRPFFRYDLRTTAPDGPDGARRFYAAVLGLDLDAEPASLAVWPLHEHARARGAPAHWLGSVAVDDVDVALGRLVSLGSEPLGPIVRAHDGARFAVVRDPLGAVMAVRDRAEGRSPLEPSPVVWHQLHTREVDRAVQVYGELFDWSATETAPIPGLDGAHHLFAWTPGAPIVGSMANTASWPGVRTHWLFYFPVADVDHAVAEVVAHGGSTRGAFELPDGHRMAPCDDPQGAAFGLYEVRPR
jgi:predicted enzyme related to lactoylglutathione lyase